MPAALPRAGAALAALKVAGAAFLIHLGWRAWSRPPRAAAPDARRGAGRAFDVEIGRCAGAVLMAMGASAAVAAVR